MEVRLTPEQEAKLRMTAAQSGREAQEIITLALDRFLEDDNRALEQLRAAIDEGDADINAGHYSDYTEETLPDLFEGIRRRGAAALAAQRETSR